MSLTPSLKLERLRRKLHDKAKREPAFRFYSLYDKIVRTDTLAHAYAKARSNRGAPGVDGESFARIESTGGLADWLETLHRELKEGRYRPQAVRRVMIPKPGGGERPLGIPTIRDRVVQTAAVLILEPIFEADFDESAYGYRPGRSAIDAVKDVHRGLIAGETQVVDADLSKYFETIPHGQLLKSVARRVADGKVLRLIKTWLKAPIEVTDERGRRRYEGGKKSKHGTPQGGVISPLLANIYLNRFLCHWRRRQLDRRLGRIVNYADDFVILCRTRRQAQQALNVTRRWMAKLGLAVNERKTRCCDARAKCFTFLGYDLGPRMYVPTGRRYLGATPSNEAQKRLKESINTLLQPGNKAPWSEVALRLNRKLSGWANYFSYGSLYQCYRNISKHVALRVGAFLRRRHKAPTRGVRRFGWHQCYGALGVVCLQRQYRRRSPKPAHASS